MIIHFISRRMIPLASALHLSMHHRWRKMNLFVLSNLIFLFVSLLPLGLWAADEFLDSEAFSEKGNLEQYKNEIDLFLKALDETPKDYEAQWKCARAYRDYGKEAKQENIPGWKNICAHCGKEGMKWAQKAMDQEPGKPEGYYYFGLNAGIYSDGVSKFIAFKEGLKSKVQHSFEKVYEVDKLYHFLLDMTLLQPLTI